MFTPTDRTLYTPASRPDENRTRRDEEAFAAFARDMDTAMHAALEGPGCDVDSE